MIEVKNLTKSFGKQVVFKDINFKIADGEFVSIVGRNGAGKTTLVKILMGLDKKTSGEIVMGHKNQIGYVPQFRNIDLDYPLNIEQFMRLNLKFTLNPQKRRHDSEEVERILQQTNLSEIRDRPLGLASGGEKQKAYLAQALVNRPEILILDESTASLDVDVKIQLMDLVSELNKKHGLTVLFITHDSELTKRYTKRALLFENKSVESIDVNQIAEDMFE